MGAWELGKLASVWESLRSFQAEKIKGQGFGNPRTIPEPLKCESYCLIFETVLLLQKRVKNLFADAGSYRFCPHYPDG